jgi:flagellar biosynthetic protein FliQ
MTDQTVLDLGAKAMWVTLQVAAPVLIAVLVTGLLVSVFQAATQINEQTLSFIPKVLFMTVALVICGPWILHLMMEYTIELFNGIPTINQ